MLLRSSINHIKIISLSSGFSETDLIFDETEYASEIFQRPYQYLSRLDGKKDLTGIDPEEPEGDRENCLQILLRFECCFW